MARRIRTPDGKKPALPEETIYTSLKERIMDQFKEDYGYEPE
jgi:hypothetical protein